jgi:hypothetical protein
MSDEHNNETSKETTTDQTPPGTLWPEPNRTTDAHDGPEPVGNYRREKDS